MLKKAGVVVTAAAAGLLALSPLALAHDRDDDGGLDQHGLINLGNTTAQVPIQACNNSVIEGAIGILAHGTRNHDKHNGRCKQHNHADND